MFLRSKYVQVRQTNVYQRVCTGDGSTAIIIGIVSWGVEPCGSSDAATVYTKLSGFTSRIIETVANAGRFSSDSPF